MTGAPRRRTERRPRRWPLWVAAAAAAVLATAALVAGPLAGERGAAGGVPTVRVDRVRLVRTAPADGALRAVEATPITVPQTLRRPMRIGWLVEDGSRVEAGDPVIRFDPTDLAKELVDAEDGLRASELRTGKERSQRGADLANLDRDAELAALELAQAREFQKQDAEIFSRHEILESAIDGELAEHRREHAAAARSTRERLSDAELELLAIERRQSGHALEQARQALDELEVAAPHAGIVVLARGRNDTVRVGDTVWAGMTLAEIPDLSAMEAEVWVLEADAGGLAEGAPAEVVLEAHPGVVYPATVERVDALAKPRLRGSPVQYFGAVLGLPGLPPALRKPGQRVRATIRLDEVAEALVVPRQAVFEHRGERVVWRRADGGGFEPVPVELGPPTLGRVVVASGLAEGDEIALGDPTAEPAEAEEEEGGAGAGAALPYGAGGGDPG